MSNPKCIGDDPMCPCQDGDPCHYLDHGGTKGMVVSSPVIDFQSFSWEDLPDSFQVIVTMNALVVASLLELKNSHKQWVAAKRELVRRGYIVSETFDHENQRYMAYCSRKLDVCPQCNGHGFFRIGTGTATCRKCHPWPDQFHGED